MQEQKIPDHVIAPASFAWLCQTQTNTGDMCLEVMAVFFARCFGKMPAGHFGPVPGVKHVPPLAGIRL